MKYTVKPSTKFQKGVQYLSAEQVLSDMDHAIVQGSLP